MPPPDLKPKERIIKTKIVCTIGPASGLSAIFSFIGDYVILLFKDSINFNVFLNRIID